MNTMQQEFDAVVTHLYTQGRPAKDTLIDGPGCFYRKGSLSCAVGCRIPDAVYDPEMDVAVDSHGTSVSSLIKRFGSVIPAEIKLYEGMFERLQYTHDQCNQNKDGSFDLDDLSGKLANDAQSLGLTFTNPQGA
jgi:hypothetical protein